jgi:outer membrane biosynthesis protein TonB
LKKPVVLRIFKGDQLLGVKQYALAQIVIGRPDTEGVQVALDGDAVSLLHASIEERSEGQYFVSDLGSSAGTRKNGAAVLDESLVSGDEIEIGQYRIEFYIGAPKPKAPAAPTGGEVRPSVQPVAPPPRPSSVSVAAGPSAPAPVSVGSTSGPSIKPPAGPAALKPPGAPIFPPPPPPNFNLGSPKRPEAVKPRIVRESAVEGSLRKKKKTFAPPSKYSDVRDFVKPSKGTVVEVLVAWDERIIATHHFHSAKVVSVGSHPDNDIVLPLQSAKVRKMPVLKIDKQAIILISSSFGGELIRGQGAIPFKDLAAQSRLSSVGGQQALPLEQGEMVVIDLGDQVSLFIRYVADSPKPMVAPLFDLTGSESVGVVLAIALVATLWLYMKLYSPPTDLAPEENQQLVATIVLTPPSPPPVAAEPTPPPVAVQPTPPPVVEKVKVQLKDKTQEQQKKRAVEVTNLTKKVDPGMSASAAPNKNKTGPRQLTSPKQGGAIKTASKEGSQMQSKNRDVTKMGVFSAFGNNGAQDQLAQATTGAGELAGLAHAATGTAGSAVNREGKGLGSELKDTGMGGNGKALEGIAGGVSTKGRGSGNSGYGNGGLGGRQGVKIQTGGSGEVMDASIDREAIRRVILANLKAIRACYELELNRRPDLFGKLVLGWEIGEQGRVLTTKVKSNDLGSQDVANCIMAKLKTWRFPEPPRNQVVVIEAYPFLFSN